jgi:tRNA threonylcarbamoyladenosine biosynthesis protein TsaB
MDSQPVSPSVHDRPWLLAIDTATPQAGVAIHDGNQVAAMSWPGGRQQTTSVPEVVEILLSRCGTSLNAVGAIAVTIGPGSFTGLRVGLSLAKGLALAPERAIVGVPTLEAMAAPLNRLVDVTVPAIPAGRGRIVWAVSEAGNAGDPVNSTFDEFLARIAGIAEAVVIGEFDRDQVDRLRAQGVRLAPSGGNRAASLAIIGYGRWRRGEIDNAESLEPAYLHGRPNPR